MSNILIKRAATRNVDSIINDINEVINDWDKIHSDVYSEIVNWWYEDIDEMFVYSIDKFYKGYKPLYYRRKKTLYSMYKITKGKKRVSWDFSGDYAPEVHRVSNEYIYNIAFEQGYHGGANSIDSSKEEQWGKHPSPGTPYWRTPIPKPGNTPWIKWSRPAFKRVPIEIVINQQLKLYEKSKNAFGKSIFDPIEPSWDLVLGRYKLFNR